MAKKRGLGKGLDALIPPEIEATGEAQGIQEIDIGNIKPNPYQPRASFAPDELSELRDSIDRNGVLQPLLVTPRGESYELVAGERRLQAAKLAGLSSVPVVVRTVGPEEQLELALVENLLRADLNPLEEAEGYNRLSDEFDLSHEEIAERVGKSRTSVTNTLRLLRLSASVRQALTQNEISEGHARALLALQSAQAQSAALDKVLTRELSVRQTEALVRSIKGDLPSATTKEILTPEELALEEEIRQALGTKVQLRRGKSGGSLTIRFYSDEELNSIVDRILNSGID